MRFIRFIGDGFYEVSDGRTVTPKTVLSAIEEASIRRLYASAGSVVEYRWAVVEDEKDAATNAASYRRDAVKALRHAAEELVVQALATTRGQGSNATLAFVQGWDRVDAARAVLASIPTA